MNDIYDIKEGKKLRCGYTTGSCSAAAAKAAVIMFTKNYYIERVSIDTPAGIVLDLEVKKPFIGDDYAICCIVKDAGDDPDVTDGMDIYVKVTKRKDNLIVIDGGEGIGRITRYGFMGKIGEAAINTVPRKMIESEIRKISPLGFNVIVYAPMGDSIAKKTFNKNIGIEGGISIIGTSGIVHPMSDEALLKTIYLEIDTIFSDDIREVILYPGNYGENMVKELGLQGRKVKISNFIGDSLIYCYNKGFKKITLVGHIGKLSKLSIGAFNTHSRNCDVRMEAFIYYLALKEAPYEVLNKVKECITTEEALDVIYKTNYSCILQDMKKGCIERMKKYVKDDDYEIELFMYSMKYGVL